MTDNKSPSVILFLDCLGYKEAKDTQFLGEFVKGKINSGIPRVTPIILGQALTGKKPTDNGLLCPTRFRKDNLTRPLTKTFIEEIGENRRILSFEIPFTMDVNQRFGVNIGSAPQVQQEQRPGVLALPRPGGSLVEAELNGDEEELEKILHGFVDYARNLFSTIRTLMRNNAFDAFLVSFRMIDSFGHFLKPNYRRRLIKYVDFEIGDILKAGDVDLFVFSDHGIRKKQQTFYINKFLQEKGFLDVDIHYKRWKRQREQTQQPELTQIGVHSPFVEVKEDSVAISPDAYDSGVKLLTDDKSDLKEVKEELIDSGYYRDIYTPKELYGEGRFDNDTLGVDLVADRKDGVLVTGNLHKELDGVCSDEVGDVRCQGEIRSGCHTREGFWASTDDIGQDTLDPTDLCSVIKQFVDRNAPRPDRSDLYGIQEESDQQKVRNRLEELGYI